MSGDKITVLYICPDYTMGGSAQSLYNLIDSVKDYVHPIVLLTSKGLGYDYCVEHGIECIVHPYMLLHFSKRSIKELLLHPWRLLWAKFIRHELTCRIYVRKYLRGRQIDIVHSNVAPLSLGTQLAKSLHAKHVWHVREMSDYFEIFRGLDRLQNEMRKADARIAISNAVKDHWQLPEDNTWVINDAIRTKKDACYYPDKKKYLIFCSYILMEEKGTRNAIRAFGLSGMAKQGYTLKLIGKCTEDYKIGLENTARDYNVLEAIEFVGLQADVRLWFAHATAYIMASISEGLGRVTGEALFYGCPVIAYETGGTTDLIKHGETGYLYHTDEECAELIKKVCSENQEPLILLAQEFAINNLSQEVYGPKIMNVYKSVLEH